MDEILPHLYLCDRETALDEELLTKHNIQSVISVTMEPISFTHFKKIRHHKLVQIEDDGGLWPQALVAAHTTDQDLLTHLPGCISFISRGVLEGGVLVHGCVSSRSPWVDFSEMKEYRGVSPLLWPTSCLLRT